MSGAPATPGLLYTVEFENITLGRAKTGERDKKTLRTGVWHILGGAVSCRAL